MSRSTLIARRLGTVSAVAFTLAVAAGAHAQCAFPHPVKARKVQFSLVGGFGGCNNAEDNYTEPNAVTANGIPACAPATAYHQAGYPDDWIWDATRGKGLVQFKARTSAPVNPLNPPGNTTDLGIAVKIKGVAEGYGFPATGDGSFTIYLQQTGRDRANGDLSAPYFLQAPLHVERGSGKVKTTVDTLLNGTPTNQPGLPHCANVALLGATVIDPNGNWFARSGLLLR